MRNPQPREPPPLSSTPSYSHRSIVFPGLETTWNGETWEEFWNTLHQQTCTLFTLARFSAVGKTIPGGVSLGMVSIGSEFV